jgi:hypothetical protein
MIPDKPDAPLLPTAYRGSLAMAAEAFLKHYIGGPSPHGYKREEGWRGGYLIHRCTDQKSGAWVEVTPGERYMPHKLVAQGGKEHA